MNRKHLDQALAALADALESGSPSDKENNPLEFIAKIPKRAINGDLINGGKIFNFSSSGIDDKAKSTQISISDDGVSITKLKTKEISNDITILGNLQANEVLVDVLTAKRINADIQFDKETSVEFSGKSIEGKGLVWKGQGNVKQFVYSDNHFFSSESINIHQGKKYSINGTIVLDENELGGTITKSNLRELGRLKGLVVDGHVNINNYLFYNADSDRIGLGTEVPKAALTVAEDMIEVSLGTKDESRGFVGTNQSHAFDIVTGDISRISIASNGNIILGNNKLPPVNVTVHGKLSIRVPMPDPEVDLHINGAIKYDNHTHRYDKSFPTVGSYNKGDIVWNSEPKEGSHVGWTCVMSGAPGTWLPFGRIGN